MAYLKPQSPIKFQEDHIYPLTTADQVILSDGTRLEKNGEIVADRLSQAKPITLIGDVTGTGNFDGGTGITVNTVVSASKYFSVMLTSTGWSASAPYTQTVNVSGIRAGDNPLADINMAEVTDSTTAMQEWNMIGRISTADDSVTAYCYTDKPTIDLPVNFMIVK